MKVVVDLVRVSQDWDPDTNEHRNTAHLRLGGEHVEVLLTEAQLKALIDTAVRPTAVQPSGGATLQDAYDEEEPLQINPNLPIDSEGNHVFGGDAADFSLFKELDTGMMDGTPAQQPGETPAMMRKRMIREKAALTDPAAVLRAKREELRQRAKTVPHRRPPADEAGNPIATQRVVVTETPITTDIEDSDDLFAQG